MTFLPLLFFGSLPVLGIVAGNASRFYGWRAAAVRGHVLWGFFLVLTLEVLSPLRAVTQRALTIAWLVLLLVSLAWLSLRLRRGTLRLPKLSLPDTRQAKALLFGVGLILGLTCLIAFLAPPHTWDSLKYHMPRVAQWAQHSAVVPFATGIEFQNTMPPGAEFAVLHTYVLESGDRWVNLVAWSAFLVNLLAASAIAKVLGASTRGQLASIVFAATLPMAIVQASSTMTDGFLASWLLAAALEIVVAAREEQFTWGSVGFGSLAAGLAALTKPTAIIYLTPLALLAAWLLSKRWGLRRVVVILPVGLLVFLALNIGHWSRNFSLYKSPFGPPGPFDQHLNEVVGWRPLASNLLRNAGLHLGTPSPHVNKGLTLLFMEAHDWMGIERNDSRLTFAGNFRVRFPSTHEDLAGSWLHGWLLLLGVGFWMTGIRQAPRVQTGYTAAVLLSFVLFSLLLKWQVFGVRLQLPFFLLISPSVGVFSEYLRPRAFTMMGVALLLASSPWVFQIESRPLFIREGSSARGLLSGSRQHSLFANGPYLERPYIEAVAQIRAAGCDRVGLMIGGNGAEYPLWNLLGKPRVSTELAWIVAGTPSAELRDPSFRPCAVFCEGCEGQAQVSDLPLAYERSGFRLYLHPGR